MGNEHWVEVSFKNVITTLESGSRPKGGVKGISEGIPSIGAEHLDSDGGFDFSNVRYIPESFAKNMKRGVVNQGDILIVKDGATTGKVSLVAKNFPFKLCCINEHVFICRLDKNISNEYTFYFLRSQTGQEQIMAGFHGGAQGGINSAFVDNIYFPLPPFNEQKRIVEKLEAILPKVRQSRERLEKILIILKKFRQSVLAAACSGRLTEEWRKGKGLPEWEDRTLSAVCKSIFDGDHMPPPRSKKGIPFLVISNVNTGKLSFENTRFVPLEYFKNISETRKPEKGDILYTITGSFGIPVYIDTDREFCFQRHMALLKPDDINGKYIYYIMQTTLVYMKATEIATGIAQLTVPIKGLRELSIPFAPLSEQQEIVRRVETLFALADSLEKKYQSAISRINKIEQAVLAKAFRGELAEADPDDEPAGELLERILRGKTMHI
jgi:type I restriction enzyme S subunit